MAWFIWHHTLYSRAQKTRALVPSFPYWIVKTHCPLRFQLLIFLAIFPFACELRTNVDFVNFCIYWDSCQFNVRFSLGAPGPDWCLSLSHALYALLLRFLWLWWNTQQKQLKEERTHPRVWFGVGSRGSVWSSWSQAGKKSSKCLLQYSGRFLQFTQSDSSAQGMVLTIRWTLQPQLT